MTLKINMLPDESASGGLGIGVMTSAGNPWSVPDALANELVNRRVATYALAPFNDDGSLGAEEVFKVRGVVSGAWILNGATSGQDSGWVPYVGGMRLAYALDSGTASTTFAVDYSVNGATSDGQAFTGTWASSTVFERTPPLWLSEYEARFIRVTVTSGGPLSVYRF